MSAPAPSLPALAALAANSSATRPAVRHPRTVAALTLAAGLFLVPIARCQEVAARPDLVHVAAWAPTVLDAKRLLANDSVPPGTVWKLLGVSGGGSVRVEDGTWVYSPGGDPLGTRVLRYELRTPDGERSHGAAYLRVVPEWLPVAGRWAAGSGGEAACALGDGEELGLWNARTGVLQLCDLRDHRLVDCTEFDLGLGAETTRQSPAPRLPVVGDWRPERSGDEIGLFQPAEGRLEIYGPARSFASGPDAPSLRLDRLADVTLAAAGAAVPLAGRSTGGDLELATYDLATRRFRSTGGDHPIDLFFAPGAGVGEPLLGDWDGRSGPSLGLWDPQRNLLDHLSDPAGGERQTVGPWLTDAGESLAGVPMVGRWSSCSSEAYLGLFDPATRALHIPALFRCKQVPEQVPDGPCDGAVHATISLDPGDGGLEPTRGLGPQPVDGPGGGPRLD